MQTYYQKLREKMESVSSSFKWWTWLNSQLQYYGGICSIVIMLLLIGGAAWTVFQQARKYREELVGCLCGNFWVSRLIQICTWDSWKSGQRVSREMMSRGGLKEMMTTESPKRNLYASSSLVQTPCSQVTSLLSSRPSNYQHSPASNWTESLKNSPFHNLISETSTTSNSSRETAPSYHDVTGVRPVRPDEHGRSRSPID